MSLFVTRPLFVTVLTERLVSTFYDSLDWLDWLANGIGHVMKSP